MDDFFINFRNTIRLLLYERWKPFEIEELNFQHFGNDDNVSLRILCNRIRRIALKKSYLVWFRSTAVPFTPISSADINTNTHTHIDGIQTTE